MDSRIGVIGAGPAGVSAAVQLKRYKINSVILEKRKIGGLIENAYKVENTMLFPNGISGKENVKILRVFILRFLKEHPEMENAYTLAKSVIIQ